MLAQPKINQYSLAPGTPGLRSTLSSFIAKSFPESQPLDPNSELCITTSGTEALFVSFQAIINPGDEVIVFEPYFPWYMNHVRMCGG